MQTTPTRKIVEPFETLVEFSFSLFMTLFAVFFMAQGSKTNKTMCYLPW